MLVRFEGGPLGGEQRDLPDDTGYRYRIPTLRRRSLSYRRDLDTTLPMPGLDPYDIQEYEYDGEVFTAGPRIRRYRWVDPYDGLRERIKVLERSLELAAEKAVEQADLIAELEDRPADVNEAIEAAVRRALKAAFS
ncbi:MAG: hypothetical protein LC118_07495 [Dehalococcoidia bacterium]|nr:hypothetical protein [Dehalococcoidia bacterium]